MTATVLGVFLSLRIFMYYNKEESIRALFVLRDTKCFLQDGTKPKGKVSRKAKKEIKGRQKKVKGILKAKCTAGKQKKK